MSKKRMLALGLGLALAGASAPHPALAEGAPDADNTARNVQDRNDQTLTPLDQGNSEADRRITQEIRKAVVDQDDLSTNAKNVKIITKDGVVTLRGPVESEREKQVIASAASSAAGVKRVDDQIEVETDVDDDVDHDVDRDD